MAQEFTAFPKLPPEVRHMIWRDALDRPWFFSCFRREDSMVKLVGETTRSIGQASRESRALMKKTHIKCQRLGWINFSRHLFFFGDGGLTYYVSQHIFEARAILLNAQHIVINPRDSESLKLTLRRMAAFCKSVRTVVMVMPPCFLDPDALESEADEGRTRTLEVFSYTDWQIMVLRLFAEPEFYPLPALLQSESFTIRHNFDLDGNERSRGTLKFVCLREPAAIVSTHNVWSWPLPSRI